MKGEDFELNELLKMEEEWIEEGFREGEVAGSESGDLEGKKLGYKKGVEIGSEVGKIMANTRFNLFMIRSGKLKLREESLFFFLIS